MLGCGVLEKKRDTSHEVQLWHCRIQNKIRTVGAVLKIAAGQNVVISSICWKQDLKGDHETENLG